MGTIYLDEDWKRETGHEEDVLDYDEEDYDDDTDQAQDKPEKPTPPAPPEEPRTGRPAKRFWRQTVEVPVWIMMGAAISLTVSGVVIFLLANDLYNWF